MKKRVLLIGATALLCVMPTAKTQSATPRARDYQTSDPSLRETTSWLADTIPAYSRIMDSKDDRLEIGYTYTKIESIEFDGCRMQWQEIKKYQSRSRSEYWSDSDGELKLTRALNLGDMDQFHIDLKTQKTNPPSWEIWLRTSDKKPIVLVRITGQSSFNKSEPKPMDESEYRTYASMSLGDHEMATRIVKALSHAITLCGGRGKKDPF